ncbi:hypothetical protein [Ligilactobacillus ruminis]|uniref:hypothetical protein n=1 Tax=Ligilactobacillus ruminis TaxID=1623 RepID=UPI0022DF04FA|nr:hypothetical protein [Ligilactobacillus ruminis]
MKAWRADLSGDAFGKSTAVYGHIDENGQKWPFVRKNSDVSAPVLRTKAPKRVFCP